MHDMATGQAIDRTRLVLLQGDLTDQSVDAIVNAANSRLAGGGGVDGAIHRRGGPDIMAECRTIIDRIGQLEPGDAVRTTAGRLNAKHVVHTVGPIYKDGNSGEAETLARAWTRSLEVAHDAGARTVAFPAISTGVYGYPVADAARVSLGAVLGYLREHDNDFDEVRVVLFSADDREQWEAVATELSETRGRTTRG